MNPMPYPWEQRSWPGFYVMAQEVEFLPGPTKTILAGSQHWLYVGINRVAFRSLEAQIALHKI